MAAVGFAADVSGSVQATESIVSVMSSSSESLRRRATRLIREAITEEESAEMVSAWRDERHPASTANVRVAVMKWCVIEVRIKN